MCGRYSLEADIDELIQRYKAIILETNFNSKSEIFPTDVVPIVKHVDGNIQIQDMKWGFMPSFAKTSLINARSETVDIKPTFKDSFINRRCIIPATSFFEWEKLEGKKIKRRINIDEEKIFSIAGLYNTFIDNEGKKYEAFTILTTSANESMKHIHDRMPVIIPRDKEYIWLNKSNRDISSLKDLIFPWKTNIIYE
ncbi:SOS response-associated peptidase [Tissierella sp. Yu-01]|uniref:SOS response-associated peptidase n=1 Tax=Tissierella sp. Yu-01 TaxID=3035694 RepID=UPI00240D3B86|nr:SOS response-associated peptidase [Tissierella sp. Yu-01]WFA09153.1 SOS response-associated peptidase [Tissierella sp. Yu-01]